MEFWYAIYSLSLKDNFFGIVFENGLNLLVFLLEVRRLLEEFSYGELQGFYISNVVMLQNFLPQDVILILVFTELSGKFLCE